MKTIDFSFNIMFMGNKTQDFGLKINDCLMTDTFGMYYKIFEYFFYMVEAGSCLYLILLWCPNIIVINFSWNVITIFFFKSREKLLTINISHHYIV